MRITLMLLIFFSATLIGCSDSSSNHNSAFAAGNDRSVLESTGTATEQARVKLLLDKIQNLKPLSDAECKDIPLLANLQERPISNELAETIARYQHFYGNGLFKAKRGAEQLKGQLDFTSIFRDHSLHAVFLVWNEAPEFLRDFNKGFSEIDFNETPTMAEAFEILGTIFDGRLQQFNYRLDLIARPAAYESWGKTKLRDVRLLDATVQMVEPAHLFRVLNENCKQLPQDTAEVLAQRIERLAEVLKELHSLELASGRDAAKKRCIEILSEKKHEWKPFDKFVRVSDAKSIIEAFRLTSEMCKIKNERSPFNSKLQIPKIFDDMETSEEERRIEELEKEKEELADGNAYRRNKRLQREKEERVQREKEEASIVENGCLLNDVNGTFTPVVSFAGTEFGISHVFTNNTPDKHAFKLSYSTRYSNHTDNTTFTNRFADEEALSEYLLKVLPISPSEKLRVDLSSELWQFDNPYRKDDTFVFDDLSFPTGVRRKHGFCKKCGGDGSVVETVTEHRPTYTRGYRGSSYNRNTGEWTREYSDVLTGTQRIERAERVRCPYCASGYDLRTSHLYKRMNRIDMMHDWIHSRAMMLSRSRVKLSKCRIDAAIARIEEMSGLTVHGLSSQQCQKEVDFPVRCGARYPTAISVLNVIERETGSGFALGVRTVAFFKPGSSLQVNHPASVTYKRSIPLMGDKEFTHVALSPDGRQAITVSRSAPEEIWDPEKAPAPKWSLPEQPRRVAIWDVRTGRRERELPGTFDDLGALAVSRDGKRVFAAARAKKDESGIEVGVVWDLKSGKQLSSFQEPGNPLYFAAMNDDGSRVLTGTNGKAILWNGDTGKPLKTFGSHPDNAVVVALSSDGSRALTASILASDPRVVVWDTSSDKQLSVLEGHQGGIWCVAMSGDGRYALTGSSDKNAIYWDTKTGKKIWTLTGHRGELRGALLSPDGRKAVTCSNDFSIKVWDLGTGKLIETLTSHFDPVNGIALSRDGRRLLSGSTEAQIWESTSR